MDKKLYRSKLSSENNGSHQDKESPNNIDFPTRKYKKRKRSELGFQEVFEIINAAFVDKLPHDHVARRYHISKALVNSLLSKAKRKPNLLTELRERE
jgi:predicted DNA-binding protein (UPF0251 family)